MAAIAWRPAGAVGRFGKHGLASPGVPRLRRPPCRRRIRGGTRQPADDRRRPPYRDHVRRDAVVAVPPPADRRCPRVARRRGAAHPDRQARRTTPPDRPRPDNRWQAVLRPGAGASLLNQESRITNHESRIVNRESLITNRESQITNPL